MLAKIIQIISWPFFYIIFKIFLNLEVKGKENLEKLHTPLLIVSNHKTFYDCFVYRVALGINGSNILPLRFIGAKHFHNKLINFIEKIGIVKFVYFIFGVFPIEKGKEYEALIKIREVLKKNGTVAMFPEGEIVHKDALEQFKEGASFLALTTNVTILPTAIKTNERKSLRKKYTMIFGIPFKLQKNLSYKKGNDYIRSTILNLYKNAK